MREGVGEEWSGFKVFILSTGIRYYNKKNVKAKCKVHLRKNLAITKRSRA